MLTLTQRFILAIRNIPAKPFCDALRISHAEGFGLTFEGLMAHYFCGGDIIGCVRGMRDCKEHNVAISWLSITVIDLASKAGEKKLQEVLQDLWVDHVYRISTLTPNESDELIGFTRDGRKIRIEVTVRYRIPSSRVLGFNVSHIHERIAVQAAIMVNRADSVHSLQLKQKSDEETLVSKFSEDGVFGAEITYKAANKSGEGTA